MVLAAVSGIAAASSGVERGDSRGLMAISTGPKAELRETVPITARPGHGSSVLSLPLPRVRRGDEVRFNAEVALTTTCVDPIERCIGRSYGFDPHLSAWMELAASQRATHGRRARRVSRRISLTCQQTRPNRNHHCPLVIESGGFHVHNLRGLPCRPTKCRLNMVVRASNDGAQGGEVVVVGADQPDGTIEGGKARISAAMVRDAAAIRTRRWRTTKRRAKTLPSSFSGGHRVVYSQRVRGLRKGDVLLVRSRQRTEIHGIPYFVSDQIIVTTDRSRTNPSGLARRILSRGGRATELNGFNCTLGHSAFESPCVGTKAGMVQLKRAPVGRHGRRRPLFVNLVSRTFPKLAQARGSFPPASILRGGSLTVRRLREHPRSSGAPRRGARS